MEEQGLLPDLREALQTSKNLHLGNNFSVYKASLPLHRARNSRQRYLRGARHLSLVLEILILCIVRPLTRLQTKLPQVAIYALEHSRAYMVPWVVGGRQHRLVEKHLLGLAILFSKNVVHDPNEGMPARRGAPSENLLGALK